VALYETYYHCRCEPFSLTPDPYFLYGSASHREALAQMQYVIEQRKGFAVLCADVGLGKTILLHGLLEHVGRQVRTAYIFNPPRSVPELYALMGNELELGLNGAGSAMIRFNDYLLDVFRTGGTVALVFDEAQHLPISVLEEIRLLSNIEAPNAKLLQVILAGQPELDVKLDSYELRALQQRIVFRYSLAPLGLSETAGYIVSRLNTAGADRSPFTPKACHAIYRYSKGNPRLINQICDNAMLAGYTTDSPLIDTLQIEEAAADLRLERRARKSKEIAAGTAAGRARSDGQHAAGHWRRRVMWVLLVACCIAALTLATLAAMDRTVSLMMQGFGLFLERHGAPGSIEGATVFPSMVGSQLQWVMGATARLL
jgi:general secretion pathway protein A